jgi:hypothetical protein
MSDAPDDSIDMEAWPLYRAEMLEKLRDMREQFASLQGEKLEPLRRAAEKFVKDLQNAVDAGDAEYRRRHPGAVFDPS